MRKGLRQFSAAAVEGEGVFMLLKQLIHSGVEWGAYVCSGVHGGEGGVQVGVSAQGVR